MRESLEDWQVAEPDGLWDGIESGLARRSARRKVLPFWIGAASAAAAVALAVFLPVRGNEEPEKLSDKSFAVVDRTMEASPEDEIRPEIAEPINLPLAQPKKTAVAQAVEINEDTAARADEVPLLAEDYPDESRVDGTEAVQAWDQTREAVDAQQVRDYWKAVEDGTMDIKGYVRSRRKLTLAASVGGAQGSRNAYGNYGGFAHSEVARHFDAAANLDGVNAAENEPAFSELSSVLLDNLDKDIATSSRHHQPVRYALELEYMLTDRLGLAGGLSYSRHSSEITSGSEGSSYTTRQKIDYIGVPLSLDLYLLKKDKAGLYVGVGGAMEKAVAGRSVTGYAYSGSSQTGETCRFVEKPLQWSVNASMGANLRIFRGLKLFAEPGVSYYFDNGSDIDNIYKERPLMFNFQVGLRTDLR